VIAAAAVVVVALLHVWFFVLESFLWTTPLGMKLVKATPEQAAATAVLAKNQGLYNLFLAAGLLWGLSPWTSDPHGVQVFFLACVVVAGVVGAITASKNILAIQALPGAVALALVLALRA
jgi:putative membrane protein